jgi:hypothetical protein
MFLDYITAPVPFNRILAKLRSEYYSSCNPCRAKAKAKAKAKAGAEGVIHEF